MTEKEIRSSVTAQMNEMTPDEFIQKCRLANISTSTMSLPQTISALIDVMVRSTIESQHHNEIVKIKSEVDRYVENLSIVELVKECQNKRIPIDTNFSTVMRKSLYDILVKEMLSKLDLS